MKKYLPALLVALVFILAFYFYMKYMLLNFGLPR